MEKILRKCRVVVTGLGAISPFGCTTEIFWQSLVAGKSGIRKISRFDPSGLPCRIAGEIPDFEPQDFMSKKDARRYPRSAQIALASARLAFADAGIQPEKMNPERSGVVFGTGMGGFDLAYLGIDALKTHGVSKINPFTIPGCIPNLSAYILSKTFTCLGPNLTVSTACATGTQAIGTAADLIRHGKADIVITGGTESLIKDFALGGFAAMRALPVNYNDNPEKASRPFDKKREGFVFSEGSGTLILESLEHALNRNAGIYAEITGQASSSDGYHMAAPDPDGAGPARAMKWALEDAGIQPQDVDYINAHGSSTALNDSMETSAIKAVFGEHAYRIPVSSIKSMIGHPMGASGALEAIACIKAIGSGVIPPTINYEYPDSACDLDYVPNHSRRAENLDVVLSNSFGLGGQNACLIIEKFEE